MSWLDDRAALKRAHVRSYAVGAEWHGGDVQQWLRARFDALPEGDAAAVADAAEQLLGGAEWVEDLLAPLIGELGEDPLFEPPLRIHRDPLRTGAILFDHRAVSISVAVTSADALAALPPPATVVVPGRLTVVRYHRATGARLAQWQAPPIGDGIHAASPCWRLDDLQLADGAVVRCDGRVGATLLAGAVSDVVTLTAMIRYGAAPFMREYAVAGGALVRTATLDETASRTTMLLTLLRLGGRADAGAVFEAASRSPAFHLRWSAMREWLALDVAAALPRLGQMAEADPDPQVRAAASATLQIAERRADQRLAA